MARFGSNFGSKAALGALALALVGVPVASAFATAEDPTAALTDEQVGKGRQLFNDNGCNACHTLADASAAGSVGPSFDGKGEYSYHDGPTSSVPMPPPTHPDVRFYGTTELPNVVEKTAGAVQDTLNKE